MCSRAGSVRGIEVGPVILPTERLNWHYWIPRMKITSIPYHFGNPVELHSVHMAIPNFDFGV